MHVCLYMCVCVFTRCNASGQWMLGGRERFFLTSMECGVGALGHLKDIMAVLFGDIKGAEERMERRMEVDSLLQLSGLLSVHCKIPSEVPRCNFWELVGEWIFRYSKQGRKMQQNMDCYY